MMVTGAGGRLGRDAKGELLRRGHETFTARFDITDPAAVSAAFESFRPDAVIHCAAWTDVDGAEDPENRSRVFEVNAEGTALVSAAAERTGAKTVYISTDYVFDGESEGAYRPDDKCFSPLNVYGASKLAGEQAVQSATDRFFIVRTQWLFGQGGPDFVRSIAAAGRKYDRIRVVSDQIGSPTYTKHLAVLLTDMAETEKYGFYHAANEGGSLSRYELACEICRLAGIDTVIEPVTTEGYGAGAAETKRFTAARPKNASLDTGKLAEAGFSLLPDRRIALADYLKENDI